MVRRGALAGFVAGLVAATLLSLVLASGGGAAVVGEECGWDEHQALSVDDVTGAAIQCRLDPVTGGLSWQPAPQMPAPPPPPPPANFYSECWWANPVVSGVKGGLC